MPALGETEGELLVEADRGRARPGRITTPVVDGVIGRREECGERVAVGGLEHEVVVGDGRARDPRDRRLGVEVEAHAWGISYRTSKLEGRRELR